MNRRWCIIDVSNRCHAAFHTTGGLAHGGEPTGVLFGFFRDLRRYAAEFDTPDFVFAFDSGPGLREAAFPFYKETRRKRKFTDTEAAARDELRRQIDGLRTKYLPELGYGNVFAAKGYEADDVIASVVADLPPGDTAVIVSSDRDLYQLLSRRVSIWTPGKTGGMFGRDGFAALYGVHPTQWPEVKAIAGDSTDDITGVAGVGEPTAAKWVRGELGPGKKRDAIAAFTTRCTWCNTNHSGGPENCPDDDKRVFGTRYNVNLELVTLPYPGCPAFRPVPDAPVAAAIWDRLCDKLGFSSLRNERVREPVRTGTTNASR